MGSNKGRGPPPHLRRSGPGPGMMHGDPYGLGVRPPPPGPYPPFDMLPPPEVMEQKLAVQHGEMQKLATENQRLASSHGALRQELAAAQHELQMLHAHIETVNSERDMQMRGLMDKTAKMEAELKAAEPLRSELQQARGEAESLVASRQELMSKVHQLSQDLNKAHVDAQQIPTLMSELESLRQEYQRCRVSYEYEKKLFNDHLESLQVMEKNYVNMTREVEKLRLELANTANADARAGVPYGAAVGRNDKQASARPSQNMYGEGYGGPQGQMHSATPGNPVGGANPGTSANMLPGTAPAYVGSAPRPGFDSSRVPAYDPSRVPAYDPSRGQGFDASRGPNYDPQAVHNYNAQGGSGYDPQRVPGYDLQRQPTHDTQRGPGYDIQQGFSYDGSAVASYNAMSRGSAMPQGQLLPTANNPYGSATPPGLVGSGYEARPRGGNPTRK